MVRTSLIIESLLPPSQGPFFNISGYNADRPSSARSPPISSRNHHAAHPSARRLTLSTYPRGVLLSNSKIPHPSTPHFPAHPIMRQKRPPRANHTYAGEARPVSRVLKTAQIIMASKRRRARVISNSYSTKTPSGTNHPSNHIASTENIPTPAVEPIPADDVKDSDTQDPSKKVSYV